MLTSLRVGILVTALALAFSTLGFPAATTPTIQTSHVEDVKGIPTPAITGHATLSEDGANVTVTGITTGVPTGTTVSVLYRNQATIEVHAVKVEADGALTTTIPAGNPQTIGSATVRLSIKRTAKRPSASATIPVKSSSPWANGSNQTASPHPQESTDTPVGDPAAYTYTVTNKAGRPATWNTCQPIAYQVNPDRMPDGAQPIVDEAFAYVSRMTGITFTPAGTSDRKAWVNGTLAGTNAAPGTILVTFTTASDLPGLAGPVLALGGFDYEQTGDEQSITSGAIAVDVDEVGGMMAVGFGPGPTMGTVLIHELGHALNLGHSNDPTQVMYPVLGPTVSGHLQAGDRAGLATLKRTCA